MKYIQFKKGDKVIYSRIRAGKDYTTSPGKRWLKYEGKIGTIPYYSNGSQMITVDFLCDGARRNCDSSNLFLCKKNNHPLTSIFE